MDKIEMVRAGSLTIYLSDSDCIVVSMDAGENNAPTWQRKQYRNGRWEYVNRISASPEMIEALTQASKILTDWRDGRQVEPTTTSADGVLQLLAASEKQARRQEKLISALKSDLEGVQKMNEEYRARIAIQDSRISELEQLGRERVAIFKRKDDQIVQQVKRISELEAQLHAARAEPATAQPEATQHPATAKLLTLLQELHGDGVLDSAYGFDFDPESADVYSPLESALLTWLDAGAPGVTRG